MPDGNDSPVKRAERNDMTEAEFRAELAKRDAMIADLRKQQASKITLEISKTGYVNIKGLPDAGWKDIGFTPRAWEVILGMSSTIKEFIATNGNECAKRHTEYKTERDSKKMAAVG